MPCDVARLVEHDPNVVGVKATLLQDRTHQEDIIDTTFQPIRRVRIGVDTYQDARRVGVLGALATSFATIRSARARSGGGVEGAAAVSATTAGVAAETALLNHRRGGTWGQTWCAFDATDKHYWRQADPGVRRHDCSPRARKIRTR